MTERTIFCNDILVLKLKAQTIGRAKQPHTCIFTLKRTLESGIGTVAQGQWEYTRYTNLEQSGTPLTTSCF